MTKIISVLITLGFVLLYYPELKSHPSLCLKNYDSSSPINHNSESKSSPQPSKELKASKNDTTFSSTLDEVTVIGKNAWIEGNKYVFIPEKRAKNISGNMTSLIDNMNMGVVTVKDGAMVTTSGEPVTIFINGELADNMDKATFWPKNALKVEYMPFSDNEKFLGYTNILNFIVKEYEAGGLTRLTGLQYFPISGYYEGSSKLSYKKMTYNAIVNEAYNRDHFGGYENTEIFRDIWYDDQHYDEVLNREASEKWSNSSNLYGGLNARYRGNKWVITHSAAIQWNIVPNSESSGVTSFKPSIIEGNSVSARSHSNMLAPTISGYYQYLPGGKWSFNGNCWFLYNHNKNYNLRQYSPLSPIINQSLENRTSYGGTVSSSLQNRRDMYFQLSLSGSHTYSNIHYSGYTDTRQKLSDTQWSAILNWYYRPSNSFYVFITPKIIYDIKRIDQKYSNSDFLPDLKLYLKYSFNSKHSINFSWNIRNYAIGSSTYNDVILRQSELKWIEGNPFISSPLHNSWFIGYDCFPTVWYNSSIIATITTRAKQYAVSYYSGGKQYDGIIGKYYNVGNQTDYTINWEMNFTLLNGNLRLRNTLHAGYFHSQFGISTGSITLYPEVRYYLGNFCFAASYKNGYKTLTNGGTEITKAPDYSNISVYYGNGQLNCGVTLESVFWTKRVTKSTFESFPYSFDRISWERGRRLMVNLTYTFDYGKKIDPQIDIRQQDLYSTSVLGL